MIRECDSKTKQNHKDENLKTENNKITWADPNWSNHFGQPNENEIKNKENKILKAIKTNLLELFPPPHLSRK